MKFFHLSVPLSIQVLGLIFKVQFIIDLSHAQYYRYEQEPEECLVATRMGMLRGKVEHSRNGKKYCSYLGIPYANTPGRFEEAELGQPWAGIRDATKFGAHCPQWEVNTEKYIGHEDCLYLNVHYPLEDQCQKPSYAPVYEALPVLVHIHGGAFELGSGGDSGPKYIMDGCTVFVSMNYRLGALGFLTTNDGLIPGNLGLKDQILSLQWIQENVECFGGNPNLVTLLGISTGSSCISHLITSPTARGLFHRAIAQSGAASQINKNPTRNARALAKRLNCTVDNTTSTVDLRDCLLTADVMDIVASQRLYKWNRDPIVTFGPSVEHANASNPIHTTYPINKLLSGDFNRVPVIMGFTEDEGVLIQALPTLMNPNAVSDLNTKWNEIAPIALNYDEDLILEIFKDHFSNEIRQFYFGNRSIDMGTFQNLTNLHSDRYFVQSIMDTVEIHSRYAPVYPYVFTYKEGFNFVESLGYDQKVAVHGSDTQFVFTHQQLFPELKKCSPQADFSQKLLHLWLTFAATGNPSETWPRRNIMKPYKNNGVEPYNWYKIDDEEIKEIPNYLQERREFWKHLGLRNFDYSAHY